MPYDQLKSVRALNPYCAILEVLKNYDVFVQETRSGVFTYFIIFSYFTVAVLVNFTGVFQCLLYSTLLISLLSSLKSTVLVIR